MKSTVYETYWRILQLESFSFCTSSVARVLTESFGSPIRSLNQARVVSAFAVLWDSAEIDSIVLKHK